MNDKFEEDALLALGGQLSVEVSQAMNMRHLQTSVRHASLMRNLQIFGDSVRLSLCSRNPATVQSRVELAVEFYQKITRDRDLMSPRLRADVDQKFQLLAAKGLLQ